MPGEISRSYQGPKDGRLPTWMGECSACGKSQPSSGWHHIQCHDGDDEFFCSEQCLTESCDYLRGEGER